MKILTGIFLGNALSSLLFVIVMCFSITYFKNTQAATNLRNRKKRLTTKCTRTTLNYLAKGKRIEVYAIRIYSQDIEMEFGIEEYATLIKRSGKRQMTEGEVLNQQKLKTLGERETYNYL